MAQICPKCGFENVDDTDFCARCQEYLRWDQTGLDLGRETRAPETEARPQGQAPEPAPTPDQWPTPSGAPSPPSTPAEGVLVHLRSDDGDPLVSPSVTVEAGGQASVVVLVRNQSPIVDIYDLSIEGVPAGWSTLEPKSLSLLPFESVDSGYEQEAVLTLRPPRSPEARAGAWPLAVVAASRSRPDLAGRAPGTMVVEPYSELEATLRPQRAAGERRARFRLAVRNGGNASETVQLTGEDPESALRFAFQPPALGLAPGSTAAVELDVDTGQTHAGVDRELPFTLRAASDAAASEARGAFVHKGQQRGRWRSRGRLLALRIALTLVAAALLIGGSFAKWTLAPEGELKLEALCTNGNADGCLSYDATVDAVAQDDVLPAATGDWPAIFFLVSSAGFLTLILGVLAVLGLRKGRSTWLAGALGLILVAVLAIRADPEPGLLLPSLGALTALVAGFLPVLGRE